MKKTAVCLLSSFLILTAAMAAGQESCPSIIHVSGMQAVYAADNEAGNPASKKKDMEADSSDAAETERNTSAAEDSAAEPTTAKPGLPQKQLPEKTKMPVQHKLTGTFFIPVQGYSISVPTAFSPGDVPSMDCHSPFSRSCAR